MPYSAELIMKRLNVLRVNPFPVGSLSFILQVRANLKKKVFVLATNSGDNY